MTAVRIASTTEPQELNMLASSIRAGVNSLESDLRRGLRTAIGVGKDLLEVQRQLPKRQLSAWLEENCELSKRQAELFMQLARHAEELELRMAEIPDLSLNGALQLIAKPKSPSPANAARLRRGAPSNPSKSSLLDHWKQASEFEQKVCLAAMPCERLLVILPEGFGLVPASTKPKNGFAAIPLPDGDNGLGLPDFLDRRLITTH